MKFVGYSIFGILLFVPALAATRIPVRDPFYYDVLSPYSGVECRLLNNSSFGYLFHRATAKEEVEIYVINNGVNEGEKTKLVTNKFQRSMEFVYFQQKSRHQNFATYLEFMIETRKTDSSSYKLPATLAITEAFYTKDENGNEREVLYPGTRLSLLCSLRK